MQKKLKIISATAAALLTLAPVAAPLAVHADSVAVTPGSNDDLESRDLKVTLTVKNAYALGDGQNVSNVQTDLSSNVGKAELLSTANVYIVKATDNVTDANSAKAAAVKDLKAGGEYVAVVTDAGIKNLQANKEYNLSVGGGSAKAVTANDFGIINSLGLIKSKSFKVPDSSIPGTPYFTKRDSDTVITNAVLTMDYNNVNKMVEAIQDSIDAHGGDSKNTAYDSDLVSDLTSQLQAQNIKVEADGSFKPTNDKLTVNYIVHFANGKTGTLPVTFNINKNAVDPTNPIISISDTNKVSGKDGAFTYSDLDLNSNVTANDIAKAFKAKASKTDDTAVDVTVQSSNLNTAVPGIYTIVLQAKNKDGKTSTATVSVTVKAKDNSNNSDSNTNTAKNMTVQYEDGESIPIYKVKDGKAVKSGMLLKNGSIVATFGQETIDGVSYTKIVNNSGSMLVPTKYLDGSYQKQKRTVRRVMHAAWVYTENGQRKNKTVFHAYSKITTMGSVVKIGNSNFYKIDQNAYVKAGNIDGTKRNLVKKAYIYNNKGRIIKTKRGARYAVKKGKVVITYGAHFKIGKHNFYRVGKGQYIKMGNFGSAVKEKAVKNAVATKAVTAGSNSSDTNAKNNTNKTNTDTTNKDNSNNTSNNSANDSGSNTTK